MEQWQDLENLFTLSSIPVLVSCSPYHNFAVFVHLFPQHWNVDTILDMPPQLTHNKRCLRHHTFCDIILLYGNFKEVKNCSWQKYLVWRL